MVKSTTPTSRQATLTLARKTARIALWTTVGVAVAGVERLLPTPLPWVRLGLANGAALIVLLTLGMPSALLVNVARTAVVALLFGTWASPSFLLSLTGGIAAVLGMALVQKVGGRFVSAIGISAFGAFVHMLVQFVVAMLLFVRHSALLAFAGPSLITAVISGLLVGVVAELVLRKLPARVINPGVRGAK